MYTHIAGEAGAALQRLELRPDAGDRDGVTSKSYHYDT